MKDIEIIARAIDKSLSQVLIHCNEVSVPTAEHFSIQLMAEAALKALADNGLVVVPRDPTTNMLKAAIEAERHNLLWKIYVAMIDAYEKEKADE